MVTVYKFYKCLNIKKQNTFSLCTLKSEFKIVFNNINIAYTGYSRNTAQKYLLPSGKTLVAIVSASS